MVLSLIILQIIRGIRLVNKMHVVDNAYTALPVSDERISRRRAVDVVLTAGEIPHEIAPVHPVQLIVKEERKVLEESRLLVLGSRNHLSSVAHI